MLDELERQLQAAEFDLQQASQTSSTIPNIFYLLDELERQLEAAEVDLQQASHSASTISFLDMDRIRDNIHHLNELIADGIEVILH